MLFCLLIISVCLLALPFTGHAQRKRAFMVGISNYRVNGYKVWDNIHGAEDVQLLTPELKKKGFKVQSLTNEAATYKGITRRYFKIQRLKCQVRELIIYWIFAL